MISTHFNHLEHHIPDLRKRKMLDLGSGRGDFLIYAKKQGCAIEGLEYCKEYVEESFRRSKEEGIEITLQQGKGEAMPYEDNSFDFINMAEVIEHVQEPDRVMNEVYRVLKPGGKVYVSVPSRFSFNDPHFHLYGVNWVPRSMSDMFISIFGKHKDYSGEAGEQRLADMHYYTMGAIKKMLTPKGFSVEDIRENRIREKLSGPFVLGGLLMYKMTHQIYFKAFHLMLTK